MFLYLDHDLGGAIRCVKHISCDATKCCYYSCSRRKKTTRPIYAHIGRCIIRMRGTVLLFFFCIYQRLVCACYLTMIDNIKMGVRCLKHHHCFTDAAKSIEPWQIFGHFFPSSIAYATTTAISLAMATGVCAISKLNGNYESRLKDHSIIS